MGYICSTLKKVGLCTLIYGGTSALFTLPATYRLAYERGIKDATVVQIQQRSLDKIADQQYRIVHPDTHKPFVVDFSTRSVAPYNPTKTDKRKQLEELF